MNTSFDRRDVLLGLASLAGSMAVPATLAAGRSVEPAASAAVLLLDGRITPAELLSLGLEVAAHGDRVVLQPELVRQWRDGLWRQLQSRGAEVRAWVRWDHALLLQGMAREERRQATVAQRGPALFEVRFSAFRR